MLFKHICTLRTIRIRAASTIVNNRLNFNLTNFLTSSETCNSSFIRNFFDIKYYSTVPINMIDVTGNNKVNFKKQLGLRGKSATKHQEKLIDAFIETNDVATTDQWDHLINSVVQIQYGILNELNIDGKIVESCIFPKKLDLARSYLIFIKACQRKFNGAVVTAFIKVCYLCKEQLTEQDVERIKSFTQYLRNRYNTCDTYICDSIVKGYILQNEVDEAINFVKLLNEENKNTLTSTYSAIIIKLLENHDVDTARTLLIVSLKQHKNCSMDDVFMAWINMAFNNRAKLEEFLDLLKQFDIIPSKIVCEHLLVAFENLSDGDNFHGEFGTLSNSGMCSVCKKNLAPVKLEENDFQRLRELFLNDVLVGNDIFVNSHPSEFNRFLEFVKREGPFDAVIDGLNVSYMVGIHLLKETHVQVINNVINYFLQQNLKCCVIGRQHMLNWPNLVDSLKSLGTSAFFSANNSEDDPFVLYAAMYSGKDTLLVTRDLFRSEKFRLKSAKECNLFKRWQQSRQVYINHVSASSGRVYIRTPITFCMDIQKDDNSNWHVPHIDGGVQNDQYGIHRQWLCLQKN